MSRLSRRRFLKGAATVASAACVAPGVLARSGASQKNTMRGAEAMEAALERLAKTGPEYAGRLANHGPMAAEALVVMDRPDAVVPWVDYYRGRLHEHPAGARRIDPEQWREALGQGDRVGDWIVFFDRRLDEKPWGQVLAEWVPRLSPGIVAAAFHGVIRTAHAVRSLDATESPARRRELAEGLAYWASTYTVLPESRPRAAGRRKPSEAIGDVQAVPTEKRQSYGNIVDRLTPLDTFAPFAGVADLVDATGDASAFISNLTETFAGAYLVNVPKAGGFLNFFPRGPRPSAKGLFPPPHPPAAREELPSAWGGRGGAARPAGGGEAPAFFSPAGPSPAQNTRATPRKPPANQIAEGFPRRSPDHPQDPYLPGARRRGAGQGGTSARSPGRARRARAGRSTRRTSRPARSRSGRPARRRTGREAGFPSRACGVPSSRRLSRRGAEARTGGRRRLNCRRTSTGAGCRRAPGRARREARRARSGRWRRGGPSPWPRPISRPGDTAWKRKLTPSGVMARGLPSGMSWTKSREPCPGSLPEMRIRRPSGNQVADWQLIPLFGSGFGSPAPVGRSVN